MSALAPLPAAIDRVCAEHFGHYTTKRGWSPPNRCDVCPLHAPCMTWGASRPHTMEQLVENRKAFVTAALAILGAGAA